ncbi:hypothetical protein BpHYR1_049982 [Brachionus plicatilis]|uniref:Uncharacterized protein n=1 Tax=Brachionus plicatilis TaxID=10195 RepID=A0A3M7Q1E0_BRAPC|nr:hypothetical protein BpHYR1_049982 [Brachionus plicatilis]
MITKSLPNFETFEIVKFYFDVKYMEGPGGLKFTLNISIPRSLNRGSATDATCWHPLNDPKN